MQTHIKSHPHSSINILAIPFGAPSRSLLRLGVVTRHGHSQRSARALTSRVAMALPVVHFVTGNHNKLLEVREHTGDVVLLVEHGRPLTADLLHSCRFKPSSRRTATCRSSSPAPRSTFLSSRCVGLLMNDWTEGVLQGR